MEQPTIVKSRTGLDLQYLQIQARIRNEDGTLHIQGLGVEVNRNYGISADIDLSEIDGNFVIWLDQVPKLYVSMAGTDKKYFVCQMRYVSSTDSFNIQVSSDPHYNTFYGGAFNIQAIKHADLLSFWAKCMGIPSLEPQKSQPEMIVEIED